MASRALALSAVLLLPTAAIAQTKTTVMVPARDGTQLATDVWRLDGDTAAHPVLLRRTPYGRAIEAGAAKGLTGLGYVVVSQDVRGRGDSKGEFLPFLNDAKDGYDAMDWVAKQPFSDGKIGTYGSSAEGVVQLMALGEGHPALKCAHVGVASDDVYGALYPGGAWRTELTTAWLNGLMEAPVIPLFRQHETADAFWSSGRLDAARRSKVKASVFFMAAQYDIFSENPRTFRSFAAEADPAARGDQFMVLGAWTHGGLAANKQGDVTFPETQKYEKYIDDLVAYFDWCLKGGPRPTWPRVRSQVVTFTTGSTGTVEERGADTWPPSLPKRTLYLHDDSTLGPTKIVGAPKSLDVDPSKPIPSSGGGNLTTVAGPTDQRAIDARPDVFLASTAPVDKDAEIIGEPVASIWASSTSDDFDVIVRLSVVTADGPVLLVSDGVRRARFAKGYSALTPIPPNTPTKMEVQLGPVSVKLTKGQRLRVAVQGTSSPRYEANPGVAQPLSAMPAPKASTLKLWFDEAHPSAIELPTEAFASAVTETDAGVTTDGGSGATPSSESSGGCGCTTPGRSSSSASLVALLFLGSAAIRRGGSSLGPRREAV